MVFNSSKRECELFLLRELIISGCKTNHLTSVFYGSIDCMYFDLYGNKLLVM